MSPSRPADNAYVEAEGIARAYASYFLGLARQTETMVDVVAFDLDRRYGSSRCITTTRRRRPLNGDIAASAIRAARIDTLPPHRASTGTD